MMADNDCQILQSVHRDALRSLAENVHKDVIIASANLADYLIVPSFMSFCTYEISERCRNLSLVQLREFLNENDDFDEKEREIIKQCPEFENI